MDLVVPTFSLEASDSQSGCGSSHTSVISAIVATILSSSSPTALLSFFGNGDTSDFPTTFSEGSSDLCLVCLTGVVTQGSGAAVDDEEDAPPDSALVCSPPPSESVLQLHRLSPGVVHPAFLVCLTCFWHPVPWFSVVVLCGAFQMGSFLSPTTASGGLPRVVAAVFHGVHSISATASVDQLLSSVSLLTVRVRKTPAFASNNVFVGVRVSAQPATIHKLCLAFLQM